jgi:L,D-transpeptidase ErfK/SrfK
VIGKTKNPVWRNPHKPWSKDMPEYIPPGPGNPLGPRAIYLSAPLVRIHGTPSISSIGRAASHGCIRMYPWDVIDLYPYVSLGTPVSIRW